MKDLAHIVKLMDEVEKEPHRCTKLVPDIEHDQSGNIQNRHIQQRVIFQGKNL